MNLNEKQIRVLIRQQLIKEGFFDAKDSPVLKMLGFGSEKSEKENEKSDKLYWQSNLTFDHHRANPEIWKSKKFKEMSKKFKEQKEIKKAIGLTSVDQEKVDLDLDVHRLYADRFQPFIDMLDAGTPIEDQYTSVYGIPDKDYKRYASKLEKEKNRMDIDGDGDLDSGDIITLTKKVFNDSAFNVSNIRQKIMEQRNDYYYKIINKVTGAGFTNDENTITLIEYFKQIFDGNFFFKKYNARERKTYDCIYINTLIFPSFNPVKREFGVYESEDYSCHVTFIVKAVISLENNIELEPYNVASNYSSSILFQNGGPKSLKQVLNRHVDILSDEFITKYITEKEKRSDDFLQKRYFSKLSKSIANKSLNKLYDTIAEEERIAKDAKEKEVQRLNTERLEQERLGQLEKEKKEKIKAAEDAKKSRQGDLLFKTYGVEKGRELFALKLLISDDKYDYIKSDLENILINANTFINNNPIKSTPAEGLDMDIAGWGNIGKILRRGILELRTQEKETKLMKVKNKLEELTKDVK